MLYQTLLDFYKKEKIDPVPIDLSHQSAWAAHLAKRRNLYELHLGLPLEFLRGRKVLEFGCNTGENALVLASFGARLFLVEPHQAQHAALKKLFKNFNLTGQIEELSSDTVEAYEPRQSFDLVVCENFINCLDDRDQVLAKLCRLVSPGGFGVVSFDDRYGFLIETLRRLVFAWACRRRKITDPHAQESYDLAAHLFLDDFKRLQTSRPFSAWWQDVLLNPFINYSRLWSYSEMLPLIEQSGGEYYSGSPRWVTVDHLKWYKNLSRPTARHQAILDQWRESFAWIITGLPIFPGQVRPTTEEVITGVAGLMQAIEEYMTGRGPLPAYPKEIESYLGQSQDDRLRLVSDELKYLLQAMGRQDLEEVTTYYHNTRLLRHLWGVPCQYLCFRKTARPAQGQTGGNDRLAREKNR